MSTVRTDPDWAEVEQAPGLFIEAAATWSGKVRINVNGERITLTKPEAKIIADFLATQTAGTNANFLKENPK